MKTLHLNIYFLIIIPFACCFSNHLSAKEKPAINGNHVQWVKNNGQLDKNTAYYTSTFNGNVYISNDKEIVYDITVGENIQIRAIEKFINQNSSSNLFAQNIGNTKINYFIGEKDNWQSNVPAYNDLKFNEVWDNIDVKLITSGDNIEKVFYLHPNANPSDIRMGFSENARLSVSDEGELEIKIAEKTFSFTKPIAYQIIDGKKQMINVEY
ncbi:MAG: hypothetical protein C0594_06510, partial [Marinilabiliales bacterium]